MQKFTVRTSVIGLLKTLEDAGFEAYIAGGAVRDMLLDKMPSDFDIATNARPKDIKRLFPKYTNRGEAFGTIAVILNPDENYEITTYRSEDVYTNSRHPDHIKFSNSIFDDSARRDFTINAMYCDRHGNIIDPQNGFHDLTQQILTTVGPADERFNEDALRVLRAFRFKAQLGFFLPQEVEAAAIENWVNLAKVSSERIYVELKKMGAGSYFDQVLPILLKYELLEYFVESKSWPKTSRDNDFILNYFNLRLSRIKLQNQNLKTPSLENQFIKTQNLKSQNPKASGLDSIVPEFQNVTESINFIYGFEDFIAEYAILLTTNYVSYVQAWLNFLPFRKSEKLKLENSIYLFKYLNTLGQKPELSRLEPSTYIGKTIRFGLEIYDLVSLKFFVTYEFLKLFKIQDHVVKHIVDSIQALEFVPQTLIAGRDLISLGFKPGPELRRLVDQAFEMQLQDPSLTKDQILGKLKLNGID